MTRWLYIILASIFLITAGCEKNQKTSNKPEVITAESKIVVNKLYFSGILNPLSTQPVLSPVDGRVAEVLFQYGQNVKQGQSLIYLDSAKLTDEFRKTVSDYLQKKQSYEMSSISFDGTQALYKAGVLSKEQYLTESNRHKSDTLSYFQAKYDLDKLLPKTNISIDTIEKINLSNSKEINEILNKQFAELKITAPVDGIALFPTPEQKKGEHSGRVSVGDELKAGQLILAIGDLSGFSLKVNVNEISINLLKPGLVANITGDAFPGTVLKGTVTAVASQANPQEGGESGLSLFEVVIKVPQVSSEQQKFIHVGMTAKIELAIPEAPQIYLPIAAVKKKNGQAMVTIIDKSGKHADVPVVTGKTTLTEVAIVQGIAPGDKVVISH